jgi:hypothetical protein
MFHGETIVAGSEIITKHKHTLDGHNIEFFNVRRGDTHRNHWALKG